MVLIGDGSRRHPVGPWEGCEVRGLSRDRGHAGMRPETNLVRLGYVAVLVTAAFVVAALGMALVHLVFTVIL